MVLKGWTSVFGVEKEYERAIEDYTAALRLKPDYAFALTIAVLPGISPESAS